MDFTSALSAGESINGITSIASEKVGGYATDLDITASGISSDAKSITMFIASGTLGSTYRVEVLVTTDSSQIIEGDGTLFVTDQ